MTQIHTESFVEPRQETWEARLNRALLGAKGLNLAGVELKAKRLDTRDTLRDIVITRQLWEMGAITPEAIAKFYDLGERKDDQGKLYRDELPASAAGGASAFGAPIDGAVAKYWSDEVRELTAIRKRIGALVEGRLAA